MVRLSDTYYATADGRVVEEGHPDARYYIGPKGRRLSDSQAARWGIDLKTGGPSGEAIPNQGLGIQLRQAPAAGQDEPAPSEPPPDEADTKKAEPAEHKKRQPEGDK